MFESKIQKGKAGGYAPLDSNAKIPLQFLSVTANTFITAGTYSFAEKKLELFNNNNSTVSVTGFTDNYVTGFTFDQITYLLTLNQNVDGQYSAITANLAILASDVTITGGTYNPNNGVATFTNNSGGTFDVSGFTSGLTDTVITNFDYTPSANTFTINQSNGSAFTTTFTSVSGLTVNGGLSANTISGGTLYGDGSNLTGIQAGSGGGGGGGLVYYFNISNTQDGYYEFSKSATTAGEQSISATTGSTETAYIGGFLTPSNLPNVINLPAGIISFYLHSYTSNSSASFDLYAELYKSVSSIETLLFTSDPVSVKGTTTNMYITDGFFTGATLNNSDRLLVKLYATNTSSGSESITILSEGGQHYSFCLTTIPTAKELLWYAEYSSGPPTPPVVLSANSFAIGSSAEANGEHIIAFGSAAGYQSNDIVYSTFIGSDAGLNSSSSNYSNFIGYNVGSQSSGSSYSNFIGDYAGSEANDSTYSVFIGSSAGQFADSVTTSNFIGNNAGSYATTSLNSNFIGYNAGNEANGSTDNNFIGTDSGIRATGVTHSNFIGYAAGYEANNISYSNFIGDEIGWNSTGVTRSTFIGVSSGKYQTGATDSILIGNAVSYGTNSVNSIGSNNILIGNSITLSAGSTNSLNIGGVLFGTGLRTYTANTSVTSTTSNGSIGIGKIPNSSLYRLDVSGSSNFDADSYVNGVRIGRGSGNFATNTILGFNAFLATANTGTNQVAIGRGALQSNTGGTQNTAVGAFALNSNTNGGNTGEPGITILAPTTGGGGNTAIGTFAMTWFTNASGCTAIGQEALNGPGSPSAGNQVANIAIGNFTMARVTGSWNTGIGWRVLGRATSGIHNVAIGTSVQNQGNPSYSVIIGSQANTVAGGSTALNPQNSVGIGYGSFVASDYSVAIGSLANAGGTVGSTSSGGTAIGYAAGISNSTQNATVIGASSFILGSANNSIVIGSNSAVLNSVTNSIVLGNNSTATTSNTVIIGNSSTTNIIANGTLSAASYENLYAATGGTFDSVTGTLNLDGSGGFSNSITGFPIMTGTGLIWQTVISPITASTTSGYITTAATTSLISLPEKADFGNVIEVVAASAGPFRITQNAGQSIRFGLATTTTGASGYLESQNIGDSIKLVCTSADTVFTVVYAVGVLGLN